MTELPCPDPALVVDGTIVLRGWRESDIPAIVAACSDPLIARFIPTVPSPYREADARSWLAGHEPARRAGRALELAIASVDGERALGAIAAHVDVARQSAAVGYWLAADARGHGYATMATRLLCAWLFDVRGVGRISLTTDPGNAASQRVAERAGFALEGRLRAHELFRQTGVRRDSLVWGLLPGELGH